MVLVLVFSAHTSERITNQQRNIPWHSMKNALDYIYEAGCRNIDGAIEDVIDRIAPVHIMPPYPETISAEQHVRILMDDFDGNGDLYIRWVRGFYEN